MTTWWRRRGAGFAVLLGMAVLVTVALGVRATAGARSTTRVHAVPLLTVPRGAFEISLGEAPLWLPRSGVPETLTLIAGPPRARRDAALDTAFVGFTAPSRTCAATPAASRAPYTVFPAFYGPQDRAGLSPLFAPNGGAAPGSFLTTASSVVVRGGVRGLIRACVWLGRTPRPVRHHRAVRILAASGVLSLVDRLFAASVSNLSGATPGHGGFTLNAFDASQGFQVTARTTQCGTVARDGATAVPAATPTSEAVAIATAPCSTDASSFSFSGGHGTLTFPIADALNSPPTAVGLGGCDLDALTGATVTAASTYLGQVGCRLGSAQFAPYRRGLLRGAVAYASVDGGVAEIAPPGTAVDLVLNGRP